MAPSKRKKANKNQGFTNQLSNFVHEYVNYKYLTSLLTDPSKLHIVSVFIIAVEFFLNIFVIQNVKYTEIDWKAYMQECEGFLNGTWDYSELKGDTGPLVYPAGFVYVYTFLYYITSHGENIRLAQYLFLAIYLLQLYEILQIYIKTKKVPPYAIIISILTSYRIHSIYVLRLFNDGIAVLLFYISLNFFLKSKWTLGSIFYSLAVSIKMNILLFAPALFFTYIYNLGIANTIIQLSICAFIQLALGAPFLYENFLSYINGSFDLQRIFEHKWTVNYRFLDQSIFESRDFHVGLLLLHIFLLCIFLFKLRRYFKSYPALKELEGQIKPQIKTKNVEVRALKKQQKRAEKLKKEEKLTPEQQKFLDSFETTLKKQGQSEKKIEDEKTRDDEYSINFDRSSQLFVLPFFVANFIGIVCARSLHYQFYVWYFHSLPYLIFFTGFNKPLLFLLLALIEYCWNMYPSTDFSSFLLHGCHLLILYGVYKKI